MKSIIVAIFVVVAVLACQVSAEEEANCNKFCPYNYAPICAGPADDSEKPATFGNDCALEVYNCQKKSNFVVKYNTECKVE